MGGAYERLAAGAASFIEVGVVGPGGLVSSVRSETNAAAGVGDVGAFHEAGVAYGWVFASRFLAFAVRSLPLPVDLNIATVVAASAACVYGVGEFCD